MLISKFAVYIYMYHNILIDNIGYKNSFSVVRVTANNSFGLLGYPLVILERRCNMLLTSCDVNTRTNESIVFVSMISFISTALLKLKILGFTKQCLSFDIFRDKWGYVCVDRKYHKLVPFAVIIMILH